MSSGYNGRRGPNVSQYVANLNTISPQPSQDPVEPAGYDDDFSLFLNADFVDSKAKTLDANFDLGSPLDFDLDVDLQGPRANPSAPAPAPAPAPKSASANGEQQKMDFAFGDFQFADYTFANPISDGSLPTLPQSQAGAFPVQPSFTSPVSSVSPVNAGFDPSTSGKQGSQGSLDESDFPGQHSIDDSVRVAAEEDKRRRNTAASARFRIKKKQREQALEKTAKEMTERVSLLESRIQQLETENTWLKGLITEKNGGGKTSKSDLAAMVLRKTEGTAGERSTGNHTDGVGTRPDGKKA